MSHNEMLFMSLKKDKKWSDSKIKVFMYLVEHTDGGNCYVPESMLRSGITWLSKAGKPQRESTVVTIIDRALKGLMRDGYVGVTVGNPGGFTITPKGAELVALTIAGPSTSDASRPM